MEPQAMVTRTRVRISHPFKEDSEHLLDLKAVVQKEHFEARRAEAIGSIYKWVPGIKGDAVLIKHEDEDGHGRFNGEVAAYYAAELERL
jgi:hypothetical protein